MTCPQPLDLPCAFGTFKKPVSSIGSVGSLVITTITNLTSNSNSVQIDKRNVKVKSFGTTKPNVETTDMNVACVHCLSKNYCLDHIQ